MKTKLCIFVAILLALTQFVHSEAKVTEKKEDYCSTDSLGEVDWSNIRMEDERAETDNMFTDEYTDIINYFQDDSNSEELWDSFQVPAIFLIILYVFLIVSFVIFLLLCCGLFKRDQSNMKPFTIFTIIFFVLFVMLFITIVIFLSLSQDHVEDTLCALFKIPSAILDGNNDSANKFIGLNNLKRDLESFRDEVNQAPSLETQFLDVRNKDIQTLSNRAWNVLVNFVAANKMREISDGEGEKKTPNSILRMSDSINPQINKEFTDIDLNAERLFRMSEAGIRFKEVGARTRVQASIDKITPVIGDLVVEIQDKVDPGADSADEAFNYAIYSYWFIFGFGLIIIILSIIIIIILLKMCDKNTCWNCMFCAKMILVFLSLLTIILAILVFLVMIASASISGLCGFVAQINKNNVGVLYDFDFNENAVKIAEICLFNNSTGKLVDMYIPETATLTEKAEIEADFDELSALLDGISSYKVYLANNSESLESKAIIEQLAVFEEYKTGLQTDFDNVQTSLNDLNDLIACDNISFEFNTATCDGEDGCKSIISTNVFSAPSCSDDTTRANDLFSHLKTYINDESSLMVQMQVDLGDLTDPDSVHSRYQTTKNEIVSIKNSMNTIESKFSGSIQTTDDFESTWFNVEDCRSLKEIVVQFEKKACFEFNFYIYLMLCMLSICCVFLFLMTWCICCALRQEGQDTYSEDLPEKKKKVRPPKPTNNMVESKIDFDDGEKVPFY